MRYSFVFFSSRILSVFLASIYPYQAVHRSSCIVSVPELDFRSYELKKIDADLK